MDSPPIESSRHILRGTIIISKYSKSGYWSADNIAIEDSNGNQRFGGRNDFVFNMYVNNPLEDLEAPKYESGSLTYELTDTILEGHQAQNLRVAFRATDNVEMGETAVLRLGCDAQSYSLNDMFLQYNTATQTFSGDMIITEYFKTGH